MIISFTKDGHGTRNNRQRGERRMLAKLDRFYTPIHSRLNIQLSSYYIYGYSVGLDHSPVPLEVHNGRSEMRKNNFQIECFLSQR